jgi:hypothetical protein
MTTAERGLLLFLATLSLATAAPVLAGQGGAPNPNSCGIGTPGVGHFHADPTLPGSSEIKTYPRVAWGRTGATKTP